MLISVEHEMPAIPLVGGGGVEPAVFIDLWRELSREGWSPDGKFAVSRKSAYSRPQAEKPFQMASTDSGPTIELAPSPVETVHEIDEQLRDLRTLVGIKLQSRGVGLLGNGINPYLGTTLDEYYQYRTPRNAYDYAIHERGWRHWTILNIAAMQEIVDISTVNAPTILAIMHRLTGLILFLNRNDPELDGASSQQTLSVRPSAWREHVPSAGLFGNDRLKVYLPPQEIRTWHDYLHLLWDSNPMFILGTKSSGLVFVPEHPTFGAFMSSPPIDGWKARRVDTNEELSIRPEMSHVAQTDWTYMGFARLRMFWKDGTRLNDVIEAYRGDGKTLESFLGAHLDKVLLENRSSASPPPGEEVCSLAFIVGLIENLDAVRCFADARPYSFWLSVAKAAEHLPLTSRVEGVDVTELLLQTLSLAQDGLLQRGFQEERYLEPLFRRVREHQSPSERMLKFFKEGGVDAVVEHSLYHFKG